MNKLLIALLLFALLSVSNKCGNHQTNTNGSAISEQCVALNNAGAEHTRQYSFTKDTLELDTALVLLKQAIACDSNFFPAYKNLANVYGYLHSYRAEISLFGKIIQLGHGDPYFTIAKANLYKEVKALDSAKMLYSDASLSIEQKLKKYPDNFSLLFDKIFLEYSSNGKVEARKMFQNEIKRHPRDSTKLTLSLKYLLE